MNYDNSISISAYGPKEEKSVPGFIRYSNFKKQFCSFSAASTSFSNENGKRDRAGVVLGYDSEHREFAVDGTDTHTLVYGATGSLKTRCVVMPTIKVLGFGHESMIINDSKGELYRRTAGFLKSKGYRIVTVNFRNPAIGNSWNPLYIPYQYYINGDVDKAAEFANDIASIICLSQISNSDPFWDYSAYDCMLGLILLLFRYCKENKKTIQSLNISSIIQLRRVLFQMGGDSRNSTLWRWARQDELIAASLSGSINAPNDTRNSILSVLDQKLRSFSIQPTLLDMLANNDISISDIGEKRTAVFLITPDEKTIYHRLVSLFIKQSYEYLIYTATINQGVVSRRVNYILDEFSSLPAINDFSSMISAARSRNIRFLIVAQSKNQLLHKYHEEAETISANCANWVFLTSRELALLREISELCGNNRNQLPNISVFELQHFSKERAEALVLAGRNRPCKVQLLDIDRFDIECASDYPAPEIKEETRTERISLDFDILPSKDSFRISPLSDSPSILELNESVANLMKKIEEQAPPKGQ